MTKEEIKQVLENLGGAKIETLHNDAIWQLLRVTDLTPEAFEKKVAMETAPNANMTLWELILTINTYLNNIDKINVMVSWNPQIRHNQYPNSELVRQATKSINLQIR